METKQKARELDQQRQNRQNRQQSGLSRSKAEVESSRDDKQLEVRSGVKEQRSEKTFGDKFEVFVDLPREITLFAEN